MTTASIAIAPELPLWLIAIIVASTGVLALAGLLRQLRGAWLRFFAFLLLGAALLNPSAFIEEREALKSVVAVVTDRSGSQKLAERTAQTDALRKLALERLTALGRFEVRDVEIGDEISRSTDISTALFAGLANAFRDVPPEQIGGAVLITDGQVHDVPETAAGIGFNRPVHALVTGSANDRDRRMVIDQAPRFAVVGEQVEIVWRVRQSGIAGSAPVAVVIRLDGEVVTKELAAPGAEMRFAIELPHGGRNILELEAETAPDEVTAINNSAVVTINGIRENLRVLLISGEPHAGERTWRNLLKSDPAVDLVHFTILRPPEKQDGTPINQLSLIAFPTRELFIEKIDEFDLIIFDRYRNRNVLPLLYFDNIARYVREGGALLLAAGPEFGEQDSIAQALAAILPALPDGSLIEAPFKPLVPEMGLRHPVTRALDGWREGDPQWGRWFRSVGVGQVDGEAVMAGKDGAPLLVLNRAGEGRVAMFLSDQTWLWARGFDGGGPYVQLLRRTAHWLMKEPELDEERLSAAVEGSKLVVERQSLGEAPDAVSIQSPDGKRLILELKPAGPGLWRGETDISAFGLYTVEEGGMRSLVHAGPPNPREFAEVVSTLTLLDPVLKAARGSVRRASAAAMPSFVSVRPGATAAGPGWIGFENTGASILKDVTRLPLFSGLLGLALLLAALSAMWAREGR